MNMLNTYIYILYLYVYIYRYTVYIIYIEIYFNMFFHVVLESWRIWGRWRYLCPSRCPLILLLLGWHVESAEESILYTPRFGSWSSHFSKMTLNHLGFFPGDLVVSVCNWTFICCFFAEIVKTIHHTYHVPSPPRYVHVPVPGPTVVKNVWKPSARELLGQREENREGLWARHWCAVCSPKLR